MISPASPLPHPLKQIWSAVRSRMSHFHGVVVTPRLAWTFAEFSTLVLAVLSGFWLPGRWLHPANSHLLNLEGVITDSSCGFSHKATLPAADCVRSCVRTRGAKYVLSSGPVFSRWRISGRARHWLDRESSPPAFWMTPPEIFNFARYERSLDNADVSDLPPPERLCSGEGPPRTVNCPRAEMSFL